MLESLFTSLGLSILCSRIKERRDSLLWNQVESISDSEASKIGSFLIAESNLCLVQLDGSHWRSAPHTAALSSNDLTLQLLGYGPQHSRKFEAGALTIHSPWCLSIPSTSVKEGTILASFTTQLARVPPVLRGPERASKGLSMNPDHSGLSFLPGNRGTWNTPGLKMSSFNLALLSNPA